VTLATYLFDGKVELGTQNYSYQWLEVPSTTVCSYTRDAELSEVGGIIALITTSSPPSGCAMNDCPTDDWSEFDKPCCCTSKGNAWQCSTNPRTTGHECPQERAAGDVAVCQCLDLSQFRLNKGKHETLEVRTTYDIALEGSRTKALKIGLYDSVNPSAVSYFYGAVGTFQLGSIEKSSFTQRDWFSFVTYNSYAVQVNSLPEDAGRGREKCAMLPFGNATSTGENICTRFFLEFRDYFVTQAYTFGSVYNCWAFLAVLSVLATQLNTLNLNQIFFPIQEDHSRRTVSPAIRVLSCGTIKERHGAEDDPTTPTADLLASDFTVLPAVAGGRQT
jgi:hypothetical protein